MIPYMHLLELINKSKKFNKKGNLINMEKQTLLETYSKRIAVAESVAEKSGVEFDNTKKMALAMVLDNTNKFLNEAFSNSVGTQRADL